MPEELGKILLLDDDDLFRAEIWRALSRFGSVVACSDIDSAERELGLGLSPAVVLADRRIHGEPVEQRLLAAVKRASPHSQVVIYTRIDELTRSEVAALYSMGAVRVLDRSEVAPLVERVLDEFKELRELKGALSELTRGRAELVTALLGADVGVTMIDSQYVCWFANAQQRELVQGECTGSLCWCLFHHHPPAIGPCWGCGIQEVLRPGDKGAATVQRVILTHLGPAARWLSVQAKPIRGSDGRVIAGTEAVSPLSIGFVRNMDPTERLFGVARGLVHAGLGRVRVYNRQADDDTMKLVAAASRADTYESKDYFHSLGDWAVHYKRCPYAQRAIESALDTLVDKWDSGESPFKVPLDVTPPYFLLPIFDASDEQLIGLLAADFGGWDETRKPTIIEHLATPASLRWMREGYGTQAQIGLANIRSGVASRAAGFLERQQAAFRARQQIGAASTLQEAIAAAARGFADIAPDCEFSVRRINGNQLITEKRLSVPPGIDRAEVVECGDPASLAAYVLTTYLRPLWIDDYSEYRERGIPFRGPKGTVADDIRSVARIPLRFETTVYGVLSIDSPNLHRWREEGIVEPVMDLAQHVALVLRDISIRDELEEARLRIAEAERLRQDAAHRQEVLELQMVANVADHLPLCVFVKDRQHVFRYGNKRFQQDVRKPRQEILGKTDFDLFDGKYAKEYQAADDRVMQSGNTFEASGEAHPGESGERQVHVIKTPVRAPSGRIEGVVGVYWDVTETNRWFRQVQSWRDGFLQSANAIVYAHDMNGEITFVNTAAARLLGYGTEELVGESVYDLVLPDHRDRVRQVIEASKRLGPAAAGARVHEFDVRAKDGRVLNLETATSVCEVRASENGILGVAHDVTERNIARARMADELERANALRSVATGFGRAGEVSTLHRLFMLAVTRGECLGFSRAILFLPSGQPGKLAANSAVGPANWAAAQQRFKEADEVAFDAAVTACLGPPSAVRQGDLQPAIVNLTLDLSVETEVAQAVESGRPIVRRQGKPSPIRSPEFAAAVRPDTSEDVEFVLAPLKQGGNLAAILWADRAFVGDPVVHDARVPHLDILWAETALMAEALHNKAREHDAAREVVRGMSYSLFTRAGILEFELARLKQRVGKDHAAACDEMEDAIKFFMHAGVLAARDLELMETGVGKCAPLDLNAVVAEVIKHRQDGRVSLRQDARPLMVRVSRTHAEDIVLEILVNALQFADAATGRVEVATGADNCHARLDISDNGRGIHPDVKPRLFTRFTRYPEGRMGIGLSYVKGMVEGYGGSIEESGQYGVGAHFTVRLPLSGDENKR